MATILRSMLVALVTAVTLSACGGGGGGGGTASAGASGGGGAPAPVTDLSVVAGNQEITASWSAVANAGGYELDLGTNADFSGMPTIVSTNSTSYVLKGLQNGTVYYLRIRSVNGQLTSAYSPVVTAVPAYVSGWNTMNEIGRVSDDGFTSLYSRSDSMNSTRDVLSTWSAAGYYSRTVYANTYAKSGGWGAMEVLSASGLDSNSSLSENGEGLAIWAERIYLDAAQLTWRHEIRVRHRVGGVWGGAVTLSGTESGTWPYEPTVMLDKDGNGVAAWHGENGQYYASTYDRATAAWSAARQLSTTGSIYVGQVRIGVDATGGFVLAWPEKQGTPVMGPDSIYVGRYSKTAGWSAAQKINLDDPALNGGNLLFNLAVNGAGDVFVLWEHVMADAFNRQLMLRRYAAATASWEQPLTVGSANFAIDAGTVKADAAGNALVHWKKRDDIAGSVVGSNNLAVYKVATQAMGPTEQMPEADYNIVTLDVVASGNGAFRTLYALSTASDAYERIYDFNAQTWSAPTPILLNFGTNGYIPTANDGYIATANSVGEILLTTGVPDFNYLTLQRWRLVRASFFLP